MSIGNQNPGASARGAVNDWLDRCHFGDVRDVLRRMIADGVKVQTIVTSPPYFGLRDYGVEGQIGLEQTPDEYVANMVEVFRAVRDVLADDGTLWLNLGDSYARNPAKGQHKPGQSGGKNAYVYDRGNGRASATFLGGGLKEKDLIGIPWRVAFALQQPFEKVHIKDRIDRAWLAALVDGEGCMTIMEANNGEKTSTSFPPILQVKMCDPECVEHANEITGFKQCLRQDSPSRGGKRETFQWRITGRRAADIVAEIYPYLRIKRKQAVILWNHQLVRDSYETKRGQPMPVSAREKQQQCRELIQRLNQKQDVDIPSWMIEPKITVEPGWYLRQDVIWHKPNPMPESVRDRCTKAHEYIFLLSKSERYYFDAEAIKERAAGALAGNTKPTKGARAYEQGAAAHRTAAGLHQWAERQRSRRDSFKRDASKRASAATPGQSTGTHRPDRAEAEWDTETRNKRSVWTVATEPYSGAHFATFPTRLIAPCILAGAPAGGIVLDPFFGSGTTGQVAQALGRRFIGIELNPAYKALQGERLAQAPKWAAL